MQYFTQAFILRRKNPKMYDMFMDIAPTSSSSPPPSMSCRSTSPPARHRATSASRTWRSTCPRARPAADLGIRARARGRKANEWEYVKNPTKDWLGGSLRQNRGPQDNPDGSPAVHADKPFVHEQHSATT